MGSVVDEQGSVANDLRYAVELGSIVNLKMDCPSNRGKFNEGEQTRLEYSVESCLLTGIMDLRHGQ